MEREREERTEEAAREREAAHEAARERGYESRNYFGESSEWS